MSQDTYVKPVNGWTCFHCGETFTTEGSARNHFGPHPYSEPGCVIKVGLGAERGLLAALRKAEELLAQHMNEDTALHRELYAMQHRHSEQLRAAEEAGYERGLRDVNKEASDKADRYDYIKQQMEIGSVQTLLPLCRSVFWVGVRLDCDNVADVDKAIDAAKGQL